MRVLPVFYLLILYVFIQFGWWSYLIVELNSEVAGLKTELLLATHADPLVLQVKQKELSDKLSKRFIMVLGEGGVFLIFLSLAIFNVQRSLRREQHLATVQKNFMLSVTHELKSPLASIKLYLQTLKKQDLEKSKQVHFLEQAESDTDRLTQMVNNILVAAQLENSGGGMQKSEFSFSQLVEQSVASYTPMLPKNIRLTKQIEQHINIVADRDGLLSVVNNLVENAVKYSPKDTEVVVVLKKQKNLIHLTVSDQGPGIPLEERENIFSKFYRIGNEETRANKGTGLGLYIVRQIADFHRAKVLVHANKPKGTTFEVIFSA